MFALNISPLSFKFSTLTRTLFFSTGIVTSLTSFPTQQSYKSNFVEIDNLIG